MMSVAISATSREELGQHTVGLYGRRTKKKTESGLTDPQRSSTDDQDLLRLLDPPLRSPHPADTLGFRPRTFRRLLYTLRCVLYPARAAVDLVSPMLFPLRDGRSER